MFCPRKPHHPVSDLMAAAGGCIGEGLVCLFGAVIGAGFLPAGPGGGGVGTPCMPLDP